ncbi:Gfo/Idh/MocA family protein [Aureimonas psammosilenae]|uniref:Gfo/Idh/MocA family protein n=1 Tax=Aureimonas psammosilenae TaxID=2495496 RepID=UPI00126093D0|nr:Gfo/Idh/MocA family oxidoreductase [Aureimonas psammosilenae]
MRIAIVGCGFVADYYMTTLVNHANLVLVGVFDRSEERARVFCEFHRVPRFASLDELLAVPDLDMVLNLTNPASHYVVSKAALEAGKHVWSEKPLALDLGDAEDLVATARQRGLRIASAPATVLGDSAMAMRRAIGEGAIGRVRLAYAEMEDSMVFREDHRKWRSRSGAPWPAEDEFATGSTLEHAGYYLTWLCGFFGPVEEMTAFAARLFDEKNTGQAPSELANDFSVTCLRFRSGAVARLTCGLAAPVDRSLHVIGDEGILSISDGWNNRSPVFLRDKHGHATSRLPKLGKVLAVTERHLPFRQWMGRRLALPKQKAETPPYASRIDFMRGPGAMAEAISDGRPPLIDADFSLHVTELSLVAQNADHYAMPYRPRSTFTHSASV